MSDVVDGTERWHVQHADCRFALSCMPDACVDAIVCDPPYELGFMGRRWDRTGIAFDPALWAETLRVAKPGAHLVAFGGTRTYHRMVCAIEDAGGEIRDSLLLWTYAEGFPKSKSVLKPCWEPVVLARNPLDGTIAMNVHAHGTGALNIDSCRVGESKRVPGGLSRTPGQVFSGVSMRRETGDEGGHDPTLGRWPPNMLLVHHPDCKRVGMKRVPKAGGDVPADGAGNEIRKNLVLGQHARARGGFDAYGNPDGTESVAAYECSPGCTVAALDAQSGDCPGMSSGGTGRTDASIFGVGGVTKPETVRSDAGGASRFYPQFTWEPDLDVPFFYSPKASTAERTAGLDERSVHPTMKPVALMQWLARLVTPPGGLILDPFTGSGSTGVAAMLEEGGFRFLGIEREPEYVAIAEARIQHVAGGRWKTPSENAADAVASDKKKQLALF